MLRKLLAAGLVLVLLLAGVGLYFSPHLTLHRLRDAASSGNAEHISAHVDYPLLRSNLKVELAEEVSNATGKASPALGALAGTFAQTLIDPMVDALVRPESLALLLSGNIPERARALAGATEVATEPEMAYDGWTRFRVRFASRTAAGNGLSLVFHRDGLATWKLADIDLP